MGEKRGVGEGGGEQKKKERKRRGGKKRSRMNGEVKRIAI